MTRREGQETFRDPGVGPVSSGSDLQMIGQSEVIKAAGADVGKTRERVRLHRWRRMAVILTPVAAWFLVRALVLHRGALGFPHIPSSLLPYTPALVLCLLFGCAIIIPMFGAGRSPHVLYRPRRDPRSLL